MTDVCMFYAKMHKICVSYRAHLVRGAGGRGEKASEAPLSAIPAGRAARRAGRARGARRGRARRGGNAVKSPRRKEMVDRKK